MVCRGAQTTRRSGTTPVSERQVPEPGPAIRRRRRRLHERDVYERPRHERRYARASGLHPALTACAQIAVAAVLVYHADWTGSAAASSGRRVSMLSGYLITSVLLDAWREERRQPRPRAVLPAPSSPSAPGVARHDRRRARTWSCSSGRGIEVRGGMVASFGYVTNWYLIFHQQSYFSAIGRPPMLQHLWSLAIESSLTAVAVGPGPGLKFWRPSRHQARGHHPGPTPCVRVLMALLYRAGATRSARLLRTDTHSSGLLSAPPWPVRCHVAAPRKARKTGADGPGRHRLRRLARARVVLPNRQRVRLVLYAAEISCSPASRRWSSSSPSTRPRPSRHVARHLSMVWIGSARTASTCGIGPCSS